MLKLDQPTYDSIVNLLTPHVDDADRRKGLITPALSSYEALYKKIDWSGAPYDFTVGLVDLCLKYGEVEPGKQALAVLLEALRGAVGFDQQAEIDEILRRLSQTPLSSVQPSGAPATSHPEQRKDGSGIGKTIVIGALAVVVLVGIVAGLWQFVLNPPPPTPITPTEQQIDLVGRIIDASTENPIRRAKVTLDYKGAPRYVYTDSEGVYRFTIGAEEEEIKCRVEVKADDYEIYDLNITLGSNNRRIEDIRLTPIPPSPTLVALVTPTDTPLPPTPPSTHTPRLSPTPTEVPTSTPTYPPTWTPIPTHTPVPASPTPTPCPDPQGEFWGKWDQYQQRLGCPNPVTLSPHNGRFVEQPFDRGHMFWSQGLRLYLVTFNDDTKDEAGTWQSLTHEEVEYKKTLVDLSDCPVVHGRPKQGSGFEAIWCTEAKLRMKIGLASDIERPFENAEDLLQLFSGGYIFRDSDGYTHGKVYVLFSDTMTFVREAY